MKKKNKIIAICSLVFVMLFSFTLFAFGCNSNTDSKSKYTVTFDVVTTETTTKVLPQTVLSGELVKEPSVQITSSNPEGLKLEGWYEDKAYTIEWDFGLDTVSKDITLYAKWVPHFKVNFYLKNSTTPIYKTEVKKGKLVSNCDDILNGYKIKGYYTSPEMLELFDFSNPINQNTNIYIDVENYIYFEAQSMSRCFKPFAAPSGSGSTAGTITYEKNIEDDYIRANFGYSTSRDPFIAAEALNLDITKSQKIEIIFKNLGGADQLMFYWIVKNKSGNFIGDTDPEDYGADRSMCYTYSNDQMHMSEDDDWITLTINLAAGELSPTTKNYWADATTLYTLRIQSLYKSTSTSDKSNELLIKSIRGIYDEDYDQSKTKVTFDFGNNITRTLRTDKNVIIGSEKALQKCSGYIVEGFFYDADYLIPFDLNSTKITADTTIYVKTSGGFSYSAEMMNISFIPVASTAPGSKVGTATLVESTSEKYELVNFGYSVIGDASYSLINGHLNVNGVTNISITMKNLGYAPQLALYWIAKRVDGTYISSEDYGEDRSAWYGFKSNEINMSPNSDWITVTFDLSNNKNWTDAFELVNLRIQSVYTSKSLEDTSNEFMIKSVEGIYNDEYDKTKLSVTFDFGGNITREMKVNKGQTIGETLAKEKCSGYIVEDYYYDNIYLTKFDISNTPINNSTIIYVKTSSGFLYDATSIYQEFKPVAATDSKSTVGSATLEGDTENKYVKVNFGVSYQSDPSYSIIDAKLKISDVNKISITYKNLGKAPLLALYWTAKDASGQWIGGGEQGYTQACSINSTINQEMKESDDWVTVIFDLSSNTYWTNSSQLVNLRIQSCLECQDNTNIILIKEIKGVA